MNFAASLLAVLLFLAQGASDARTWSRVWADLDRLSRLPRESSEFRSLWKDLDVLSQERVRVGRERQDRADTFRARILFSHLRFLVNSVPRVWPDPQVKMTYAPGEAWLAARVVAAGDARTQATIEALQEPAAADRETRVTFAIAIATEELESLRSWSAERIASAAYQLDRSASIAELVATCIADRGDPSGADALLARALESAASPAEREIVQLARARVARSAGNELDVARHLGAALVTGSDRAALELSRLALFADDSSRATFLARTRCDAEATRAAALRIWGLAQLPATAESGAGVASSTRTLR